MHTVSRCREVCRSWKIDVDGLESYWEQQAKYYSARSRLLIRKMKVHHLIPGMSAQKYCISLVKEELAKIPFK